MHYHSRHFRSTAQRAIDELLVEGAAKPEGIKVLSQSERLSIVEAELAIRAKTIDNGFDRIEAWIKLMVTFGGGTILFGFGTLAYKVMVYDIATNKEMKAHIERTRTEDKLENLMLSTKSKLDNLRLSMELAIRK
ncbi:hypothetical protein L873DRAFT_1821885 [Choiromyces venosus 120613-1]|uniref:Uncharacterized protein n=1 Tax=Choiromyces venosus 120613-1 TaxID=1336337 RepID=A0A3N4IVM2_9PEZI|nr:hypothetical protein L873DRAFT_1821885 [Choiromyces venosus 120613-1]